jgi:hypothetical protein
MQAGDDGAAGLDEEKRQEGVHQADECPQEQAQAERQGNGQMLPIAFADTGRMIGKSVNMEYNLLHNAF